MDGVSKGDSGTGETPLMFGYVTIGKRSSTFEAPDPHGLLVRESISAMNLGNSRVIGISLALGSMLYTEDRTFCVWMRSVRYGVWVCV